MPRIARPGSIVDARISDVRPSATLAINELCAARQRRGLTTYRLGLGQSPFPVPEPVVAALRDHAAEKDYLPVQGLPALREAVARWHERVDGVCRSGEQVLIGPGSKELMFLLQLVCDGELMLPSPSWVSYEPQARLAGRPVRWLETDPASGWRLAPETLARACERSTVPVRMLMLNSPSNPTGQAYDEPSLHELARVAREHEMIVISDEIYGPVHHRNEHVSIARFYDEGTIVSGGLSKWCGAGGWRLGTFSFPTELDALRRAMVSGASETFTSVAAPIQHAAVTAFDGGPEIERYLARSRRTLAAVARWCADRLTQAGAYVPMPQGGFYMLADFTPLTEHLRRRGITDGDTLCHRLLEEAGVAVLPGSCFGRSVHELSVRLAYVNFDGAAALHTSAELPEDAELDEPWLRRWCPDTLRAIDVIRDWLQRP